MKRPRANPGSTLLLSLWALVLLASMILTWTGYIERTIRVSRETNFGLVAAAMADSGAAVALHPLASPRTALLRANFGDRGYRATITGEGGKLNLNWLLTGQDPRRVSFLKEYLSSRGLTLEQTGALVDCMLDWVGPPGLAHLNGALEAADYHPPHRPFVSLDEVRLVKNSGPLTALADWRDDFTLYSQGPIDLLAAQFRVLSLLPGVGPDRARAFLQLRQGPDGIDGTEDDHVFESLPEVVEALSLTQTESTVLDGLVAIHDPTVRIRSTGWQGSVRRSLEIVTRRQGPIFLWQEL